jgi:hypothetical protein
MLVCRRMCVILSIRRMDHGRCQAELRLGPHPPEPRVPVPRLQAAPVKPRNPTARRISPFGILFAQRGIVLSCNQEAFS